MTDNRTNDPTEAQVEAACKAHEFTNAFGPERETRMRAALVAAAGAAPQAESAMTTENLEIMNGWLVERGVHEAEYPAGAAYGAIPGSDAEPLINLSEIPGWPGDNSVPMTDEERTFQSPEVQPSSTVDEDVLMLVIEKELLTDTTVSDEWSDFKVEKTAERITRAVVEAIGGETPSKTA